MYYKLNNNTLTPAPRKLAINGATVYNPTAEQYLSFGYKQLKSDPVPDCPEGYHLEPSYEEKTKYIYRHWLTVEDPETDPTIEEQLEAQAEAIEELATLLAEVLNG